MAEKKNGEAYNARTEEEGLALYRRVRDEIGLRSSQAIHLAERKALHNYEQIADAEREAEEARKKEEEEAAKEKALESSKAPTDVVASKA